MSLKASANPSSPPYFLTAPAFGRGFVLHCQWLERSQRSNHLSMTYNRPIIATVHKLKEMHDVSVGR